MLLDILEVIQRRRHGITNVDDENLPVGLSFVEERHDPKNLDLLDLTDIAHLLANFADVKRIIVSLGSRFGMCLTRVLPGLN